MYSLILDSTTDVLKFDRFAFVLRYCTNDGLIKERLIEETVDSTGNEMYELFCKVCEKYNLNWRHDLIGQAYDGASNITRSCKRIKNTKIQNINKNVLHKKKNISNISTTQTTNPYKTTKRSSNNYGNIFTHMYGLKLSS